MGFDYNDKIRSEFLKKDLSYKEVVGLTKEERWYKRNIKPQKNIIVEALWLHSSFVDNAPLKTAENANKYTKEWFAKKKYPYQWRAKGNLRSNAIGELMQIDSKTYAFLVSAEGYFGDLNELRNIIDNKPFKTPYKNIHYNYIENFLDTFSGRLARKYNAYVIKRSE